MTILAFGELLKPYDLLIKYKHVMGENILHISSHICYISAKRCKIILAILFFDTCIVTYHELGTYLENFWEGTVEVFPTVGDEIIKVSSNFLLRTLTE